MIFAIERPQSSRPLSTQNKRIIPSRNKTRGLLPYPMTAMMMMMVIVSLNIVVISFSIKQIGAFQIISKFTPPHRAIYNTDRQQQHGPSKVTTRIPLSRKANYSFYGKSYGSCHHDDSCSHAIDSHTRTISKSAVLLLLERLRQLWSRFDTINRETSVEAISCRSSPDNNKIILTSGIGSGLFGTIKKVHNPIVYFILGILAGFRYDWCFRSPVYWFAIGFTIKWYRARYVFKIPVWDRQPNWNNIITSKEQEKDLKAFTCKKCGSTIFIAKTREFFFEGNTGIGGLGCFSCGARGKENFIMDRERIVEDVGDMDDYFEYERPLDFISRAERRKLLKEAQGDEDKANLLLLERTTGISSSTTPATIDAVIVDSNDESENELVESPLFVDNDINTIETIITEMEGDALFDHLDEDILIRDESPPNGETVATLYEPESKEEEEVQPSIPLVSATPEKPSPPQKASPPKSSTTGLEGLDELDMDEW